MPNAPAKPGYGRDSAGRFTPGNTCGQRTRFRRGVSGNPRGRPPARAAWFRFFDERGYGLQELRRIATDPAARPSEREAARWGFARLACHVPVAADAILAHRFYRRWFRKKLDALVSILADETELPERREAARRRLRNWWN